MNALVKHLKETDQDFEWYPTTEAIINVVKSDCLNAGSVLDCGAGDGRVLMSITNGTRYAIEKAVPLIQAMDKDIIMVGTEFFQSTLIDKPVDIVFCNPPYSEYESWAAKIISEAHAKYIYLVIPSRWKDSHTIKEALKTRDLEPRILGSFDFLQAERAARAKVDILSIRVKRGGYYNDIPDDPFNLWFDNEFDFQTKEENPEAKTGDTLREKLDKAVVGGKGKVPALVELYNHEMAHLYENFKQISALDAELLKELGTSKDAISGALKQRISGLKNKYWKELFDNLEDITSRLTSKSRKAMLGKMTDQTNVDFTESNIYAVLIWVIKNANHYYDQQLIDVVEDMISKANIVNYKSNQRVYRFDDWRYREEKKEASHFGLELRIVLNRFHAIHDSDFCSWDYHNNLHNSAHDLINDLITIANNLNFRTSQSQDSRNKGEWESNKTKEFYDTDGGNLMFIKAFKNGNLHIKFNQKFIRRLNVEFGRLKGWLKNAEQASKEMDIPVKEAAVSFNANHSLTMNNIKLLSAA